MLRKFLAIVVVVFYLFILANEIVQVFVEYTTTTTKNISKKHKKIIKKKVVHKGTIEAHKLVAIEIIIPLQLKKCISPKA